MHQNGLSASRVIIITHEFYPRKGGISTYVQEMAKSLSLAGVSTTVWAPSHPAIETQTFPYPIRELPLKGTQNWSCRMKLAREFLRSHAELRDEILYLPEPGPIRAMLYLQFFKAFAPRRLVLTLHGTEILRLSSPIHRKLLFERLLRRANRIGVVSRNVHALLEERFPSLQSKSRLTSGALRSDLSYETSWRKSNPEFTTILTVGRLHQRKGQLCLLKAINRLSDSAKEKILLRFVGPENNKRYAAQVRQYANRNQLRVSFEGEVSDESLSDCYRDADIFAQTSIQYGKSIEGFGLSYLEASAFGLPIIAFRTGGVSDAVVDNKTGLLCEAGAIEDLARNIRRLISGRDLRKRLGQAGRVWASKFSWKHNVEELFSGL